MNQHSSASNFRWWVLLAIAVSSMCSGLVVMSFGPLIGGVAKSTGVDLGTASFSLIGIPMFASAVAIGLLGFVVDRVGIFPVVLAGQLLILLSNAAIAVVSPELQTLVAIRVLQGLGSAALTAAISPAMALWFPREEMGRAMGLQSIGMALGIMGGLNIGPVLAHALGGWAYGIAGLSFIPLLALIVTAPIAIAARRHRGVKSTFAISKNGKASWEFLRVPTFWAGLAAMALCYWVGLPFNGLGPGYLAVDSPVGVGYGPEGAGGLMFLFTIAGIVGPPLGGFLVDKLFDGRSKPLIVIGWILGAVCYSAVLASPVYSNHAILAAVLFAAGLANPFVNVTMMSFAAKVFPPHFVGRICGLWLSISFLAGSAGVMVCSLALHRTGTYTLSLLIIGVGSAVGLLTVPFLKQTSPSLRVPGDALAS